MRVVIDTNVFVSGLMLPASVPDRILAAAHAGGFEIVLCEPILEEISVALRYPKVRKRIALSDEELDRYVQALRYVADVVDPFGGSFAPRGDCRIFSALIAVCVFGRLISRETANRR